MIIIKIRENNKNTGTKNTSFCFEIQFTTFCCDSELRHEFLLEFDVVEIIEARRFP